MTRAEYYRWRHECHFLASGRHINYATPRADMIFIIATWNLRNNIRYWRPHFRYRSCILHIKCLSEVIFMHAFQEWASSEYCHRNNDASTAHFASISLADASIENIPGQSRNAHLVICIWRQCLFQPRRYAMKSLSMPLKPIIWRVAWCHRDIEHIVMILISHDSFYRWLIITPCHCRARPAVHMVDIPARWLPRSNDSYDG